MKTIFKIFVLAVAMLLVSTVMFSCRDNSVDADDFGNDGYILDGDKHIKPESIMKIGDFEVPFQEYRYHYLNTKLDYDGGNNKVWEDYPEYIPVLKNTVDESIIEIYAIRTLCAEAGIESDLDEVYDAIDEYRKGMSRSEFDKGLKSHYLTRSLYAYVLEGYQLYDKLFEHYFSENGKKAMSDSEVMDYAEEYYFHTRHILIYPNTSMTEKDYENHLNTILQEAQTADNFDEIIAKYSNDTTMPEYGCYFTDGERADNYVAACRELREGEISDLVQTADGWYIIKRLPINDDDTSVLRDIIYNRKYSDMIENKIATVDVEYTAEYSIVAPETVK
jgi:parvulin-like peptidyl-prolyl isomerase